LEFTYDPSGKRISKTVKPRLNGVLRDEPYWTTTFYVYDATGNVMAVYERTYQALPQPKHYKELIHLAEQHIYGSDRIGLRKCHELVYEEVFIIANIHDDTHEFVGKFPVQQYEGGMGNHGPVATSAVAVVVGSGNHLAERYQRILGDKRYELKNHLGNVLSVITDRKIGVDNVSYVSGNGTYISAPSNNQLFLLTVTGTFVQVAAADLKVDYYTAEIVKSTEYSCYGVELTGWGYVNIDSYRYGFNGKELDQDGMGGGGSTYDYGFRIYNPALGKFLSVDPLTQSYPWYTPYQFAGNKSINSIDLDGLEELHFMRSWNELGGSRILDLIQSNEILSKWWSEIQLDKYKKTHSVYLSIVDLNDEVWKGALAGGHGITGGVTFSLKGFLGAFGDLKRDIKALQSQILSEETALSESKTEEDRLIHQEKLVNMNFELGDLNKRKLQMEQQLSSIGFSVEEAYLAVQNKTDVLVILIDTRAINEMTMGIDGRDKLEQAKKDTRVLDIVFHEHLHAKRRIGDGMVWDVSEYRDHRELFGLNVNKSSDKSRVIEGLINIGLSPDSSQFIFASKAYDIHLVTQHTAKEFGKE
jgi:RHS repeat-associated protein